MDRINIAKSFLSPINEHQSYLGKIWGCGQLAKRSLLSIGLERILCAMRADRKWVIELLINNPNGWFYGNV